MSDPREITCVESITAAGLYRLRPQVYHADPCPAPSLSNSIANVLLDHTPRHAWTKHPRLNTEPRDEVDPTRAKEIGTAAHCLLLGEGAQVVTIDAEDYRSGAAKKTRAEAYSAGLAPILASDMRSVENMAAAAREQMSRAGFIDTFEAAASEVVIAWQDPVGPWCRGMADKLLIAGGRATIFDIKTSSTAVSPNALGFKIADMGYETQAGFYERGLSHVLPDLAGRIEFVHIWIEMDEPHALIATQLDGCGLTIGRKRAAAAIGLWQQYLSAGTAIEHWPFYPPGIHRIDYPVRAENQWLEREQNDEQVAAIISRDPFIKTPSLYPTRESRGAIDSKVLEHGFG